MSRPVIVIDDDILRVLLTRYLPLEEADYPDGLQQSTLEQLLLRDIQESDRQRLGAAREDSGASLFQERVEPRDSSQ